jgi:hypothetical protein
MKDEPAARGTVRFEIGRITLHGYAPGQQARFISALRAGLAELADNGGLAAAAGRQVGHLDAGVLRAGAPPEEAARRIAAQVRAALTGGAGAAGAGTAGAGEHRA